MSDEFTDDPTARVDDKFVVMKAEEWDRYFGHLMQVCDQFPAAEALRNVFVNPPIVKDAVVIRTRDIFAEQGLMAYAGAVQTTIEVAKSLGFTTLGGTPIKRLQNIADYFHDRAQEAHEVVTKRVPD